MSADYGTSRFKGFAQRDGGIHVVYRNVDGSTGHALGTFALEEIGELVQLAGQAWPAGPGVEVRYVIEMRRGAGELRRPWTLVWSALADDEQDVGVGEEYARDVLKGFADGTPASEWRLSRRTIVTADERLDPEAGGG
jgi:hypothetical protein